MTSLHTARGESHSAISPPSSTDETIETRSVPVPVQPQPPAAAATSLAVDIQSKSCVSTQNFLVEYQFNMRNILCTYNKEPLRIRPKMLSEVDKYSPIRHGLSDDQWFFDDQYEV
jgi:hypothetical protein